MSGNISNQSLAEGLQEADAEVNAVIASMEEAGVGQMGRIFMDRCLRPAMQGVVVAHHSNIPPEEVEDAITNIFLIAMRAYLKRRYTKRDDAQKAAQEAINELAKQLAEVLEEDFPTAPRIIMPQSGKIDG